MAINIIQNIDLSYLTRILNYTFLDNSLQSYAWFLGILVFGFLFKKLITKGLNWLLYRIIKRYAEDVSSKKLHELIRKPIGWIILLVVIYIAFIQLQFPSYWHLVSEKEFGLKLIIQKTYQVILMITVIWLCLRFIDFWGLILLKKAEKTLQKSDDQLIPFIIEVLKILTVIIGIFIILGSIFQLDIGSLVAGLGIGGLAVALAAKDSLENLFGSFTIFLDKPFTQGDLIKIGDIIGVVEKVGFRSTRIRTLDKSYVTVPNKKVVDSELDNLSLLTTRRGYYTIGVRYDTNIDILKKAIVEIQAYIDAHEQTDNEGLVRFSEFNKSSLDIIILYFVKTNDWYEFLRVKEEINFKIMEILKNNHIEFAFPSTTVFIENK